MAYSPDPANPAAPLDTEDSSTAAAEFRNLKNYIQLSIMPFLASVPSAGTGHIGGLLYLYANYK